MKNKYLLTIMVVVLLVMSVGLSYSYFTSKTSSNEFEGAKIETTAAKMPEFTLETNVESSESTK